MEKKEYKMSKDITSSEMTNLCEIEAFLMEECHHTIVSCMVSDLVANGKHPISLTSCSLHDLLHCTSNLLLFLKIRFSLKTMSNWTLLHYSYS